MFGTIGHARLKSGRQSQLDALNQEWQQTIRPQIPGEVVQLIGHAEDRPERIDSAQRIDHALIKEPAPRRDKRQRRDQIA